MEDDTKIEFAHSKKEDLEKLEEIRKKAFQPIFDSFKNILGETIYDIAQKSEDESQKDYLVSLFNQDSIWETWNAIYDEKIIGFVSINMNESTKVGEIGLNAIDPSFSKKGIGTKMYNFAVEIMKKAGMKVATVSTGGDPSHLPARKAYRKAGFQVEIPSVWMCQELD